METPLPTQPASSPSPPPAGSSAGPTPVFRPPEHLRILSRIDWIEPVVMFLRDRAVACGVCNQETAKRLVVAMTEAITNAIVHGNYELSSDLKEQDDKFKKALAERASDLTYVGRIVDIRVHYTPQKCTWTITDQGKGFDFKKLLEKLDASDPDLALKSGRGILIMRAFVDEVEWAEGGRQVRLAINLHQGPEKRAAPRRKYVATIGLRPDGEPTDTEAIARDLSATGIAFVAARALPPGTPVTITLDLHKPTQRSVHGRIVRCLDLAGEFHDMAVHFDQPIELPPIPPT